MEKMTAHIPRDPDWEAKVRASFARQSFMRLIGAELSALAPGRITIVLPFRADLCQQRGFLHGGVTTAIADSAAGYAAFSLMPKGSAPLTVELKINLLAPAVGERFLATAQVVRPGRTLTVVEADVIAEAGGGSKPVARLLTTLMCLENTDDGGAGTRAAL
jgi:uncharacterized protein (TIGR00369 family)